MRRPKEGQGESRGGQETMWCPVPLLPLPVGTGKLRRQTAAITPLPSQGRKPHIA